MILLFFVRSTNYDNNDIIKYDCNLRACLVDKETRYDKHIISYSNFLFDTPRRNDKLKFFLIQSYLLYIILILMFSWVSNPKRAFTLLRLPLLPNFSSLLYPSAQVTPFYYTASIVSILLKLSFSYASMDQKLFL